jgi:hypothetical protein
MRVDCNCRLAERDVEHDVRRLAAHAGKFLQLLAVRRDLTAMLPHQLIGHSNDVFGLRVEQADSLDVFLHAVFPKGEHRFGCACD